MKISRPRPKLSKLLKEGPSEPDGEIAPSLFIHELPKEIEGMPEKGDFEAHLKGKVRRHSVTTENGKSSHSYDLDCHHLECKGNGGGKKKESTRDQVEKAFKEKGPKDQED